MLGSGQRLGWSRRAPTEGGKSELAGGRAAGGPNQGMVAGGQGAGRRGAARGNARVRRLRYYGSAGGIWGVAVLEGLCVEGTGASRAHQRVAGQRDGRLWAALWKDGAEGGAGSSTSLELEGKGSVSGEVRLG